jgi:hypothetical protein
MIGVGVPHAEALIMDTAASRPRTHGILEQVFAAHSLRGDIAGCRCRDNLS